MKSIYTKNRLYLLLSICILVLMMGFAYSLFFAIGKVMLVAIVALALLDLVLLFRLQKGISADRFAPDKLSNGDENDIILEIQNRYTFPVNLEIVDEIPHQFQVRDFKIEASIKSGKSQKIGYKLRSIKRGEYHFGVLNVFATSPIGLLSRRFKFAEDAKVPVYPSYLQMRKYELMGISNRLTEIGIKKIRKIGQNMEFDQIRDYVQGDDFRSVNWKVTARRNQMMVN
ncbi:MAG: hypothetical protein ACI85I_002473 [Arenicella sp.]